MENMRQKCDEVKQEKIKRLVGIDEQVMRLQEDLLN